jgi:hypothetical protein
MSSFVCHVCGAALEVSEPIPRDAECPSCRTDVRCCRNCRHYDERYNNACTETQADPIPEKTHRNFCEYFYFSREPFAGTGTGAKRADEARSKLDALFGGRGASATSSSEARAKLDALFKKAPAGEPASDDPEDPK